MFAIRNFLNRKNDWPKKKKSYTFPHMANFVTRKNKRIDAILYFFLLVGITILCILAAFVCYLLLTFWYWIFILILGFINMDEYNVICSLGRSMYNGITYISNVLSNRDLSLTDLYIYYNYLSSFIINDNVNQLSWCSWDLLDKENQVRK